MEGLKRQMPGPLSNSAPAGHQLANANSTQPSSSAPSTESFASSIPAAPAVSLPKGGGAIHDIGEKLDVDLSTGSGTASFPIKTSLARGDFGPSLSLSYSSAAGNGPFGLGWRLSVPQITRKTDKGLPRYNDTGSDEEADVFLFSQLEDLVPVFKRDSQKNVIIGIDGKPAIDERIQDGYIVRKYSPRVEGPFNRIERWTNLANLDDAYWRTITPRNVTSIFGKGSSSQIFDPNAAPNGPKRVFSWLLSETFDSKGNAMVYEYKVEDSTNIPSDAANEANRTDISRSANRYLKRILYGNRIPNRQMSTWTPTSASSLAPSTWSFSVVFDYGEHDVSNPKPNDNSPWGARPDPFSNFHSCFEVRTYRLCRRILMFHHFAELETADYLVGSTDFSYNENTIGTYLQSAVQVGYALDSTGKAYVRKAMPPLEFGYSLFPTDDELSHLKAQEVDSVSTENLPIGLDGSDYQWVDLDGEGISGILADQGGSWFYKRNTSANNIVSDSSRPGSGSIKARFSPLEIIATRPQTPARRGQTHFRDVAGAGKLDLVQTGADAWGFYERVEGEGWLSFQTFRTSPNLDTANPNVKFLDLTGDGLIDILICADQLYYWHASLGADGYGPGQPVTQPNSEDVGPGSLFGDTEQRFYLADMSGDGLDDLVRIRNGDVCYWPNSGYGKFGPMVRMDNAPWFDTVDIFNEQRVRLADIDGSGTADILYFNDRGVTIYLNGSGNGFSDAKVLPSFPPIDNLSNMSTIDLLGNGTTCIVWSSNAPGAVTRPIWYVDIMLGKKPHLLAKISNNLGTEKYLHYAPSTKFYLQDKQDGKPWITRLPFPVHCVERLETIDRISGNRFVSTYRYHEGYFDGVEREFRGFGMVEHRDTEEYASMSTVASTNVDSTWHIPPVLTKTWFHTGIFVDRDRISHHMVQGYFGAPTDGNSQAWQNFYKTLLPDTVLPTTAMDVDGVREACRALKGKILRTEVYSEDGSAKAPIPYSIDESNYTIEALQPLQDGHRHSIFMVHAREKISYQYERVADDPRVQHELTLDVDEFGNVRRSINISYGRQPGKTTLGGVDRLRQETTLMVYSEKDYTNKVDTADDYLIPTEFESRQYQATGLIPSDRAARPSVADFITNNFALLDSLAEIAYEAPQDDPSAKQKRLIDRSRILFKRDDLTALLPAGQVQSLALPGEVYRLCLTPGLVAGVFTRREAGSPTPEILIPDPAGTLGGVGSQQAGYVDLDKDLHWWKPQGSVSHSPDPTATPEAELAEARGHFFLPRRFVDAFKNAAVVDYDQYSLFPVRSIDPAGNITSGTMDYRVLKPKMAIDPNGNRNAAAFDAMGIVVGTAVMGKLAEQLGDALDNFYPDLSQAQIDQFFSGPRGPVAAALLGAATTRTIYDSERYWRTGDASQPIYSATIRRETHSSDSLPLGGLKIQLDIAYIDGFGRSIQTKTQASPGSLVQGGQVVANRWLGSGWVIFNNKGKPIKQYEPFFDDTHNFKYNIKNGVSPIIMYDPLGRQIATLRPDHAVEKVVFDAWSQTSYDVNRNVLLSDPTTDPDVGRYFASLPTYEYLPSWYDARTNGQLGPDEKSTAVKTSAHSNTPGMAHFDVLGRTILSVMDNGGGETMSTHFGLDILGNQREVVDANERVVTRCDYDMTRACIHKASMDTGEQWILNDVKDKTLLMWNSRNFRLRSLYDTCRRLVQTWLQDHQEAEVLLIQNIYGETMSDAVAHNLLGKISRVMDQAGVEHLNEFDFKGNLLSGGRQFAKNYKDVLNWSNDVALEATIYQTRTSYDALNRAVTTTAADGSITYHAFDEGGHLNAVSINVQGLQGADPSGWTPFVTNIDYNAKNQILSTARGNGSATTFTYDKLLFRLERMQTTRPSSSSQGQDVLQDLTYTYDPRGSITHIADKAQQTIYFRNEIVEPGSDYTYDPVNRLIRAQGREHLGQTNGKPNTPTAPTALDSIYSNLDSPGDGKAMGTYVESYVYDVTGNILSMVHRDSDPTSPGWTRNYFYNEPSQLEPGKTNNRLSYTRVGKVTENYSYVGSAGLNGNMTSMPGLPVMLWDYMDQLRLTTKQIVTGSNTPETTYYVYDSSGRRLRKVTESQAGSGSINTPTILHERLYLSPLEIYRRYSPVDSSVALERQTLHVMDDKERLALIETRTQGDDANGAPAQLVRYQLRNHLLSSCLEVDDQARIISYEEYFPYGSTSYQAAANQAETPKRYRYTGRELDEESGLYHNGARYYASWLGRWTSPDPHGLVDGPNLYAYAKLNPIANIDPGGTQSAPPGGSQGGAGVPPPPKNPPPPKKPDPKPFEINYLTRIGLRIKLNFSRFELGYFPKADKPDSKVKHVSLTLKFTPEADLTLQFLNKSTLSFRGGLNIGKDASTGNTGITSWSTSIVLSSGKLELPPGTQAAQYNAASKIASGFAKIPDVFPPLRRGDIMGAAGSAIGVGSGVAGLGDQKLGSKAPSYQVGLTLSGDLQPSTPQQLEHVGASDPYGRMLDPNPPKGTTGMVWFKLIY